MNFFIPNAALIRVNTSRLWAPAYKVVTNSIQCILFCIRQ